MVKKPIIGITLGDPTGIGPEVVAKALSDDSVTSVCKPVVIGNMAVLNRAFNLVQKNKPTLNLVSSPLAHEMGDESIIPVIDLADNPDLLQLPLGTISSVAGKASIDWVIKAAHLAIDGEIDAIATAPINKAAGKLAGFEDIGHMEIFQRLTQSSRVLTMLMTKGLRVVHLTTHRSLRIACDYVTKDNILHALRVTNNFFQEQGFPSPKIAVAALNPHGGEEGLLGMEEIDAIIPAVKEANNEGIYTVGPIPADTIFQQAISGLYDVVLALYHDQGHIPIKVHGWEESITTNLGLPFIRTSVDHGTAFDIAGKGIANPSGMVAAILAAAALASGVGLDQL